MVVPSCHPSPTRPRQEDHEFEISPELQESHPCLKSTQTKNQTQHQKVFGSFTWRRRPGKGDPCLSPFDLNNGSSASPTVSEHRGLGKDKVT